MELGVALARTRRRSIQSVTWDGRGVQEVEPGEPIERGKEELHVAPKSARLALLRADGGRDALDLLRCLSGGIGVAKVVMKGIDHDACRAASL